MAISTEIVGKSYSSDGTHLCTVDTYDCCIYDGG